MTVFLTIREGETADQARPILATSDPRVLRAVARALTQCLGQTATDGKVLALVGDAED